MVRSKSFSLTNAFSGATATLQQQEELKRLRQELDQLKAQKSSEKNQELERLLQELKNFSGEHKISIAKMRPSWQARQTFPQSAVRKRAESLKRYGQQTPIILIPLIGEEKLYEIEDGELRWRAAQLLVTQGEWEWEELKAVLAPPAQGEGEVHKRSLIHNLHREDLNPLDRVEAIVKHISLNVELELSEEEVDEGEGDRSQAIELKIRKTIRHLDYRFKKTPAERVKLLKLLEASRQEQIGELEQLDLPQIQQQILSVLLELQLNINSVAANDLPMLTLPLDLKEAIRVRELPCRQALIVAKLSADKLRQTENEAISQRQQVVEKVVEASLSLKKTRELVNQILSQQGISPEKGAQTFAIAQVKAALSQMSLSQLGNQELKFWQETLTEKLQEVEQLLRVRSEKS